MNTGHTYPPARCHCGCSGWVTVWDGTAESGSATRYLVADEEQRKPAPDPSLGVRERPAQRGRPSDGATWRTRTGGFRAPSKAHALRAMTIARRAKRAQS